MTRKKITGRGGPGRGQGRKPLPAGEKKVKTSLALSKEAMGLLQSQEESAGKVVDRLIIKHLK